MNTAIYYYLLIYLFLLWIAHYIILEIVAPLLVCISVAIIALYFASELLHIKDDLCWLCLCVSRFFFLTQFRFLLFLFMLVLMLV